MSQPSIIFVHGAWHSAKRFDKVIALLKPLGYRCIAVSMPAVGRPPRRAVENLDEDIVAVRAAVVKELDAGNDVMVNCQSWGGIPASSALDGLSAKEREEDGKAGAVVKIA